MVATTHFAERTIAARAKLIANIVALAEVDEATATKAADTLIKHKLAKLDPVTGQPSIKHGGLYAKAAILRAAKAAK